MILASVRFVAVAAIAVAALLSAAAGAQGAGLFAAVDRMPPPAGRLVGTPIRSRVVAIDFEQLHRAREAARGARRQVVQQRNALARTGRPELASAPGATLILNLFGDTVVTGFVEWTEPTFSGGYSVSGRLVDDPLGTMTLVVNGARVAGNVRTQGGVYRIRSVDEGLFTVSEVEEPPLKCGVEGPHSETDDHRH